MLRFGSLDLMSSMGGCNSAEVRFEDKKQDNGPHAATTEAQVLFLPLLLSSLPFSFLLFLASFSSLLLAFPPSHSLLLRRIARSSNQVYSSVVVANALLLFRCVCVFFFFARCSGVMGDPGGVWRVVSSIASDSDVLLLYALVLFFGGQPAKKPKEKAAQGAIFSGLALKFPLVRKAFSNVKNAFHSYVQDGKEGGDISLSLSLSDSAPPADNTVSSHAHTIDFLVQGAPAGKKLAALPGAAVDLKLVAKVKELEEANQRLQHRFEMLQQQVNLFCTTTPHSIC